MEPVEEVQDNVIDTMMATNVKGLLYLTQAVLPGMKSRGSGHIINISSIAGSEAYPGGGIYCATKHAVNAISKTLRMELIHSPINVTSIEPGLVETEFSVIRFRGDKDKADSVYKGMTPLSGKDIAEVILHRLFGQYRLIAYENMIRQSFSLLTVHHMSKSRPWSSSQQIKLLSTTFIVINNKFTDRYIKRLLNEIQTDALNFFRALFIYAQLAHCF